MRTKQPSFSNRGSITELVREPVFKLTHRIKDFSLYAHVVVKPQMCGVSYFGEGKKAECVC